MTWAWDAPTGVYKDHSLSQKIRMNAVQRMLLAQFVRPEPGFGKGKGQSITITRMLQLGRASRIEENDGIPVVNATISTKSVTVSMWGVKMELTEFEENLTFFNLRNRYQELLRNNIELTVEGMIAEAMVGTPVKFIPTTGGGTFAARARSRPPSQPIQPSTSSHSGALSAKLKVEITIAVVASCSSVS